MFIVFHQIIQQRSPQVPKAASKKFFQQIVERQEGIDLILKNEAFEVAASDLFPVVIIEKEAIHIRFDKLGEGTYSDVFLVHSIVTEAIRNFEPIHEIYALKQAKQGLNNSFSPQKRKLNHAVTPQKEGIDYFIRTFRTQNASYSLHRAFDRAFCQVDYLAISDPVKYMLKVLASTLESLCSIHRHGYIHRDVKGGNILVMDEAKGKQVLGAITDFGFLREFHDKPDLTIVTPLYADPEMFLESGEKVGSLYNQMQRYGIQNPAGDIYAFGRSIEYDGLYRLCLQVVKKHQLEDLEKIIEEKLNCKYLKIQIDSSSIKNKLNEIDIKYPYLAFYREQDKNDKTIHKFGLFRPITERMTNYSILLSTFEERGIFTHDESQALVGLMELAFAMQQPIKIRISGSEALQRLRDLLKNLEACSANANSRKRKLDFNDAN